MMYLSHLMIDVGSNPDRPRPGRLWLRNIYHVHQRLSMAFPSPQQKEHDPQFLKPFSSMGFAPARFLFRIDNSIEESCPRAIVLVQSEQKPDWEYCFQNARMFLAAEPELLEYKPALDCGGEYRFRIRVNLSKKSKAETSKDGKYKLRKTDENGRLDSKGRQKDQGKRVSLTWDGEHGQKPEEVIVPWFANKAMVGTNEANECRQAFELRECNLLHLGWVSAWRPKANGSPENRQMKFRSALLEGTFAVKDTEALAHLIRSGVGSAKAFGFGLLSVVRA